MPIVPTVASPALNGAATIDAPHSAVDGCSSPIVTRTSSARRDVPQDVEHVLLALQRFEQPSQRVVSPGLSLVGQVRDTADDHVGRALALGGHPQRVGGDQQDVVDAGWLARRHPQQADLRIQIRRATDLVQPAPRSLDSRAIDVIGTIDDLLVHPAVLSDREDQQGRAHVDRLEPYELFVGRPGRYGQARVLREPRQELHRPLQHLFEVQDHVGEVRRDLRVAAPLSGGSEQATRRRSGGIPRRSGYGRQTCAGATGSPALRARPSRCGSWRSRHRARHARRSFRSPPARRLPRTPRRPRATPWPCARRARVDPP